MSWTNWSSVRPSAVHSGDRFPTTGFGLSPNHTVCSPI
jgi:hypothetical protein